MSHSFANNRCYPCLDSEFLSQMLKKVQYDIIALRKKMKKIVAPILIFLALVSSVSAEKSVEEIITIFTDNDRVPDFNYSVLDVEDILPNGNVDKMVINQYGSGEGKDLKNIVIEFKSPAKMKNTRVLQAQKIGKNDDRWVYTPSLKSVRRIPMSERYKTFVGEYTYNDMTIRELDEDKNEMMNPSEKLTVNGKTYECWKIKSTPIKKSEVEYGHRVSYFDKETYVPVRIEYYAKKDSKKMVKFYECTELEWVEGKTGIRYPLRRENVLTNLQTNRKTKIRVASFVFDDPISDGYFTQSWLQTGKARR